VTATLYDADGYPFIDFKGNAQDVGDAMSIYVMNTANPLGGHQVAQTEFIRTRDEEAT